MSLSKAIGICTFVCAFVCVGVRARAHVLESAYGGQRTALGVIPQGLSTVSFLYFAYLLRGVEGMLISTVLLWKEEDNFQEWVLYFPLRGSQGSN